MILLILLVFSGYLFKRGIWDGDYWAMLFGSLIFGVLAGILVASEKTQEEDKKDNE